MKIVVQRVSKAKVEVNGQVKGEIGTGLLLLVCMEEGDSQEQITKSVNKIKALRIFTDDQGKMNLNCNQVKGSVLAISQFTLSWDGRKGNRPSFDLSMEPSKAQIMFEQFCRELSEAIPIETGVFGADMKVSLTNDGPVTFSLNF